PPPCQARTPTARACRGGGGATAPARSSGRSWPPATPERGWAACRHPLWQRNALSRQAYQWSREVGRGVPPCDTEGKEWARGVIAGLAPQTVVDVGPGEGTYARLAREVTPGCRWIGVEAWGPYVSEYGLFDAYDWVIVADVRHLDPYTV